MPNPQNIKPVEAPVQIALSDIGLALEQAGSLVRAIEARDRYGVTGKGLSVAVLDTGIRATHEDFSGRVVTQVNFTSDNNGDPSNASDGNGHGTNVTGIIAANGQRNKGIAPGANIIPIKVLDNSGGGSFENLDKGLDWVIENRQRYNITAICMSLSDGENYDTDQGFSNNSFKNKVSTLRNLKIPIVVAAGNDFFTHSSNQGMAYPAILRDCISVGAVYDASEGRFSYDSGAIAFESGADRITPFSQRLHKSFNSVGDALATDIFAPGAPITSSGILNDSSQSIQQGTSQAAPIIAGTILLMQEYYRITRVERLPSVEQLLTWMRRDGVKVIDGDDENDNVINTGKEFIRIDVVNAIRVIQRELEISLLTDFDNVIDTRISRSLGSISAFLDTP
jgi:subtilisin family serine protease